MPKKLPKSVSPEEFKELIRKIPEKDKISKVAFILAYGSGLRVSEVEKLTPDNVKEATIEIWEAKGGRDRVVPLPKGWKLWMKDQLPLNRTSRSFERRFNKYRDKAKLPEFYTFHSLRHGFATRLIEAGVPINHIQVLMGHTDVSTTGIYLKARPQDALKSYEELF